MNELWEVTFKEKAHNCRMSYTVRAQTQSLAVIVAKEMARAEMRSEPLLVSVKPEKQS